MNGTSTCTISDCDRAATSFADAERVCLMHYKRWKRHGNPLVTGRSYSPPKPHKRACAVDGCQTLEDGARGLCKLHDTRMRRHGDPTVFVAVEDRKLPRGESSPHWTGDQATYTAAHQRVRKTRGAARQFNCSDCGGVAAHWSYDRNATNELPSNLGPYSVDVNDYSPRCVPCHKRFDLAAIRAT